MTDALEAHLQHQLDDAGRFFWHRLRYRAVQSYLPQAEPFDLVDVGAGAGILGRYLERSYPLASYRFVEPIASLRHVLRDRYGNSADATDEEQLLSARFITLLDVLEHQEDDRAFLQELVAKMNTGSTLLLTVPAMTQLWSRWDESLGHYRRYDRDALVRCLTSLPFDLHEVSYLFPELLPLAVVRRWRNHPSSSRDVHNTPDAEFPDLPPMLDDLLYRFGLISLSLRRHWPIGTSLFAAATVECNRP